MRGKGMVVPLTRQQEEALVRYALREILGKIEHVEETRENRTRVLKPQTGRKWTQARREKFMRTMRNKWTQRKAKQSA